LRRVEIEEKRAARKVEAGQALLNEAATIRRKALSEARAAGVPVAELAEVLGVSVQRVYQLLSDEKV
jgi:DNA-directed RNA polymerase specialized sigma24 family protein